MSDPPSLPNDEEGTRSFLPRPVTSTVGRSSARATAAAGAPDEIRALSYAGPIGQVAGTGASGRVYFGASVQPARRTAVTARSGNSFFTVICAPPRESPRAYPAPSSAPLS